MRLRGGYDSLYMADEKSKVINTGKHRCTNVVMLKLEYVPTNTLGNKR